MAGFIERFSRAFRAQPAVEPVRASDYPPISVERPQFLAGASFPRYNPDELVRRKGLQIYAKMRLDEQIKAVVTFKRDAVLSRGWTFEYEKESTLPHDEQAYRSYLFAQFAERMQGSFIDALSKISVGREYGFSLTEKVFADVRIGGKTWTGIGKLRGRDPSTFEFITDEYGDLKEFRQQVGGKRITLDLGKFIHYVHNPEFDEYFGQSEIREAYRSWYHKEMLLRFWGMYMEKLGGGMLVAKITSAANIRADSADYRTLQQIVSDAKASGGIVLPPGVDLDVVFPASTDSFRSACEYHDLAIAKALLVPNLAGVSNSGETGSYSQASVQLESFAWSIKADTDRLESCLNEQLFKDLGDRNFEDGEYPLMRFKPLSDSKLDYLIKSWGVLIGQGAVIPTEEDENRLRAILEMPPRTEQSRPLVTVPDTSMQDAGTLDQQQQQQDQQQAGMSRKRRPVHRHGAPVIASKAAFSNAVKRVEFAVIDRRMSTVQREAVTALAVLTARATARLLTDDRMAQLLDTDVRDITDMQIDGTDKSRIKAAFRTALQSGWTIGQNAARREMMRAGKPIRFDSLRDNAAAYLEANAFRMAGNLTDAMRAIIQQELLLCVKGNLRPADVRNSIHVRLIEKGMTTLDAVAAGLDHGPRHSE